MQEINQNFPNLVSSLSRMQVLFCGFSFLINLVTVFFFLMKLRTINCDYHNHWHSSRFTMGPYWWNCGPMLLFDLCRWMRRSKTRLFQINRCYHRARIWWLSMELSSIWKLLIFSRKASLFLLDLFISMKENVQDSVFSHYAWGWACFFRLIDLVQGELSLASSITSLKVTISSCIVGFVSSPGWQFDTWISFPNEEVLKGWVWWVADSATCCETVSTASWAIRAGRNSVGLPIHRTRPLPEQHWRGPKIQTMAYQSEWSQSFVHAIPITNMFSVVLA